MASSRFAYAFLAPLVLVACGEVKSPGSDGPDAASSDGAPNAPDAAAFGPVRVTFYYSDPVEGAPVLITDDTGAVIKRGLTGADGSVEIPDVPRGATLTVGKFLGGAPRVFTVVAVEPGDRITVGTPGGSSRNVTLTATSALAGVHHYIAGAGCGSFARANTSPITVEVSADCQQNNQWTLAVLAYSDETTVREFTVVPNATDRAPVALANWSQPFELQDFLVGFSNPPPGTKVSVSFEFAFPMATPGYQEFDTTSGTASFRFPPNLIDKLTYEVSATSATAPRSATTYRRTVEPRRMENVNIGQLTLPLVASLTGDFADTARPSFTWAAAPEGVDMVRLSAIWDGIGFYDWQIFAPATQTSFRIPAIPVDLAELIPPAGDQWSFDATLYHVDLEGSYAEARSAPGAAAISRSAYRTFRVDHL
jgi:hypothetical protein